MSGVDLFYRLICRRSARTRLAQVERQSPPHPHQRHSDEFDGSGAAKQDSFQPLALSCKPRSALQPEPRVDGNHYLPDKLGTNFAVLDLGHEFGISRATAFTVGLSAPAPALLFGLDRREMSRRP